MTKSVIRLRIFLAFGALTVVQLSQRIVVAAFEFDLGNGGSKSNGFVSSIKQFAPMGPASSFMEEPDDNAGFIAGASIASGVGGGSPPGTRRLIQPPPLKKRAYSDAAAGDAEVGALRRRPPLASDPSDGFDLASYYRSIAEMPSYHGRYYFLNRI